MKPNMKIIEYIGQNIRINPDQTSHLIVRQDKPPLGRGSFGSVYVTDYFINNQKQPTQFATKIIQLNHQSKVDMDRELQVVKEVEGPYILQVRFAYHENNTLYIVNDICTQGTLEQYCKQNPQSDIQKLEIFQKIVNGCYNSLHKKGILHRDLKQENILMQNGDPKIIDFGVAKQTDNIEEAQEHTVNKGTPMFASPQVLNSMTYSYKADVYSLGVVLYKMFNNSNPNKISTWPALTKFLQQCETSDIKQVLKFEFNVPNYIKNLIYQMMQYTEEKRISMEDLEREIQKTLVEIKPKPLQIDFFSLQKPAMSVNPTPMNVNNGQAAAKQAPPQQDNNKGQAQMSKETPSGRESINQQKPINFFQPSVIKNDSQFYETPKGEDNVDMDAFRQQKSAEQNLNNSQQKAVSDDSFKSSDGQKGSFNVTPPQNNIAMQGANKYQPTVQSRPIMNPNQQNNNQYSPLTLDQIIQQKGIPPQQQQEQQKQMLYQQFQKPRTTDYTIPGVQPFEANQVPKYNQQSGYKNSTNALQYQGSPPQIVQQPIINGKGMNQENDNNQNLQKQVQPPPFLNQYPQNNIISNVKQQNYDFKLQNNQEESKQQNKFIPNSIQQNSVKGQQQQYQQQQQGKFVPQQSSVQQFQNNYQSQQPQNYQQAQNQIGQNRFNPPNQPNQIAFGVKLPMPNQQMQYNNQNKPNNGQQAGMVRPYVSGQK